MRFNKELLHTRKGSEGANFLYSKSIPFVHENSIVVNSSLHTTLGPVDMPDSGTACAHCGHRADESTCVDQ